MEEDFETGVTDISEKELAERIIYMHDTLGLGFRRIAGELTSEGISISKDKVFRLYHKYKKSETTRAEEDEEFGQMKEMENETRKRLALEKEKRRNEKAHCGSTC